MEVTPKPLTTILSDSTPWHLYLVRCANGDLYTGISTDVERRFNEHTNNRGARRLKGKGPLQLAFSCEVGNRSQALRLEHRVKKLSKLEKEALVAGKRGLPAVPD